MNVYSNLSDITLSIFLLQIVKTEEVLSFVRFLSKLLNISRNLLKKMMSSLKTLSTMQETWISVKALYVIMRKRSTKF